MVAVSKCRNDNMAEIPKWRPNQIYLKYIYTFEIYLFGIQFLAAKLSKKSAYKIYYNSALNMLRHIHLSEC